MPLTRSAEEAARIVGPLARASQQRVVVLGDEDHTGAPSTTISQ
jgi:hypothetical protein